MEQTVLTIGYEGADIESFLATLSRAGAQHLLDVRDVPVSRKRGFSKSKLADALDGVGINYTHLKALGDPKDGREAMRRGDYAGFLTVYHRHIAGASGQQALDAAAEIVRAETTVLLCYERNPKHCHRTIVAEQLRQRGISKIWHLGVNDSESGSSPSRPSAAERTLARVHS